jgi:hypothetical protein
MIFIGLTFLVLNFPVKKYVSFKDNTLYYEKYIRGHYYEFTGTVSSITPIGRSFRVEFNSGFVVSIRDGSTSNDNCYRLTSGFKRKGEITLRYIELSEASSIPRVCVLYLREK